MGIKVFSYHSGDNNIIDNLRNLVNSKTSDKYIIIHDESVELNDKAIQSIDTDELNFDIIELKYMNEDGSLVFGNNATGAFRLAKLFPDVRIALNENSKPYIPKLVLYKTSYLKSKINKLPIKMQNLSYHIDYLLQILCFCDFNELQQVGCINDKVYGTNKDVEVNRLVKQAAYKYLAKILVNLGIRSDYYASFVYFSKKDIQKK